MTGKTWLSKVKGVGKENIGKVIDLIDIKKAPTVSSLWKSWGLSNPRDESEPRETRNPKMKSKPRTERKPRRRSVK